MKNKLIILISILSFNTNYSQTEISIDKNKLISLSVQIDTVIKRPDSSYIVYKNINGTILIKGYSNSGILYLHANLKKGSGMLINIFSNKKKEIITLKKYKKSGYLTVINENGEIIKLELYKRDKLKKVLIQVEE